MTAGHDAMVPRLIPAINGAKGSGGDLRGTPYPASERFRGPDGGPLWSAICRTFATRSA